MSPNSSTSSSEAAGKFLVAFLASAVLLLLPGIIASLYLYPPDGNLSRIGWIAQRELHPLAPQPSIHRVASGVLVTNPEVLVLGDSFSEYNAWQTRFYETTKRRTKTWHYRNVPCIRDWIDKAISRQLSSSADTVIVQILEERVFMRFASMPACTQTHYAALEIPATPLEPPRSRWAIFPMDIRHVLKTAWQYPVIHGANGRVRSGKTVLVDLVRSDLFSNARPDRLAYYIGDESKLSSWSDAEADRVLHEMAAWRNTARKQGINLVFAVVPDKSSTYWPYIAQDQQLPYPGHGEALFAHVRKHLGEPYDLLQHFRAAAVSHRDFYRPDDTHLSAAGQIFLGDIIAGWDTTARAAPPATENQ